MLILVICFICVIRTFTFPYLTASDLPLALQQICSEKFNFGLRHGDLASAFLCGTSIESPTTQILFTQTGLIHLMVVSGTQLVFLSSALEFLFHFSSTIVLNSRFSVKVPSKLQQLLLLTLLMAYALMTGFQPPVVRALLSCFTIACNKVMELAIDSPKRVCLSGILTLLIFPSWIFSFSFFLSWLAALGLCLFPWRQRSHDRLLFYSLQSLTVQSLVSLPLGTLTLSSILMNLMFSSVLVLVLMPLSLLGFQIFPFKHILDLVWQIVLDFLMFAFRLFQFAERSLGFESSTANLMPHSHFQENALFYWLFLASLHALSEGLYRWRYQGKNA